MILEYPEIWDPDTVLQWPSSEPLTETHCCGDLFPIESEDQLCYQKTEVPPRIKTKLKKTKHQLSGSVRREFAALPVGKPAPKTGNAFHLNGLVSYTILVLTVSEPRASCMCERPHIHTHTAGWCTKRNWFKQKLFSWTPCPSSFNRGHIIHHMKS